MIARAISGVPPLLNLSYRVAIAFLNRRWCIVGLVVPIMRQQCPHDTRILIRQCHRRHVLLTTAQQLPEPALCVPVGGEFLIIA